MPEPSRIIQTLLGHKTSAMTDRYTHLSFSPAAVSAWNCHHYCHRRCAGSADETQVPDSSEATRRSRTGDLITNQLLYQLS